jgi:hypothetical protein
VNKIGKRYAVREDLRPKPDLMAVIHQLEALNSITLNCASHSNSEQRWPLISRIEALYRRTSRSVFHKERNDPPGLFTAQGDHRIDP